MTGAVEARTGQVTLFAIIFEGRAGSSELVARLNSHTDIQAYPEILAPLAPLDSDPAGRWRAIEDVFLRLHEGRSIETFLEAYSKQDDSARLLPIRGFKTRLNVEADACWFTEIGKAANFYCVEPQRFLDLAAAFDVRLIHLRRRDLLRHAISWMRAVQLNNRMQLWNVQESDAPLGSLPVSLDRLHETLLWLQAVRARNHAAFARYGGRKMTLDYEDMVGDWARCEQQVLRFVGAQDCRLKSFYVKVTDDDLSAVVSNYPEVMEFIGGLRLGDLPDR